MSRDDLVEMDGTIVNAMGGGFYTIATESESTVIAKLSGKMKMNHIRVLPGDKVRIGVSPYDLTHGIIVRRYR